MLYIPAYSHVVGGNILMVDQRGYCLRLKFGHCVVLSERGFDGEGALVVRCQMFSLDNEGKTKFALFWRIFLNIISLRVDVRSFNRVHENWRPCMHEEVPKHSKNNFLKVE